MTFLEFWHVYHPCHLFCVQTRVSTCWPLPSITPPSWSNASRRVLTPSTSLTPLLMWELWTLLQVPHIGSALLLPTSFSIPLTCQWLSNLDSLNHGWGVGWMQLPTSLMSLRICFWVSFISQPFMAIHLIGHSQVYDVAHYTRRCQQPIHHPWLLCWLLHLLLPQCICSVFMSLAWKSETDLCWCLICLYSILSWQALIYSTEIYWSSFFRQF